MERSYLFYAANFEPEVNRIEANLRTGNIERTNIFIDKTLHIVDSVLSAQDISTAGKEEWSLVRAVVASYTRNDVTTNHTLLSYGSPFSQKFARNYLH